MDTQFINRRPALIPSLVRTGILVENFTLVDVGASGGIPELWYSFGDRLCAYAFDPLVAEIERLNAAKPTVGRVEYVDAYIVKSSTEQTVQHKAKQDAVFGRSSAWRSITMTKINRVREAYNSGAELRYTENRYSIDEFAEERGIESIDFIKTDTDGHDYTVLLGARETLLRRGVLGVVAEVFFNTGDHPEANLLAHNDLFLRSLGFRLFDIDVRRYTRAALPGKFRYDIPAQTLRGQPSQADALYLRDFADPDFHSQWPQFKPTQSQLLKMIALFEIFGLNDCAIELIDAYVDVLSKIADLDSIRSVLSEEACGVADYPAYMERFEQYMHERRYAAFPDDYLVAATGSMLVRGNDPSTAVFHPNES